MWATATDLEPTDGPGSIGRPIPGTWVAVVDDHGQVMAPGVEGELVVGGRSVTQGYVNDEAATAERFVDLAGLPGRVFKTGDRAALHDDQVWFLGRRDDQLNIGGVRAEPADIERVLLAEPGVVAVVVVASDPRSLDELMNAAEPDLVRAALTRAASAPDPTAALADELRSSLPGAVRLVAHIEASSDAVAIEALRDRAARDLPPLLRPVSYAVHEQLPRSPHGKVDREAAAALPLSAPSEDAPPHEPADRLVAQIGALMGRVLDAEPVGSDRSFFDAGGHSLLVMELLTRIEDEFDVVIDLGGFYRDATPRAVARAIGADAPAPDGPAAVVVPIQPEGMAPPIFGLHVLGPDESFYRPIAGEFGTGQPVYGVNIPLDQQHGEDAVAVISDAYCAAIENVAPTGPIGLAAVSMGAPFAFETARKLRARGRDLTIAALFDALGPDASREAPDRATRLRRRAVRALRSPGTTIRHLVRGRVWRIKRLAENVAVAVQTRRGKRLPRQLEIRRVIESNVEAVGRHVFEPADIRLTIFKASDDPDLIAGVARGGMGWTRVARGGVDVVVVEGGHTTMLAPPYVAGLATSFVDVLDRGDGATAGPVTASPVLTSREDVEHDLIGALADGRLVSVVARLAGRDAESLSVDARALVGEVDATLVEMADAMRAESDRLTSVLTAASVSAEALTIPPRVLRAVIEVRVASADASDAVAALGDAGYRLQRPYSAGAWTAHRRLQNEATLIALDERSTRLRLVWGPDRSAESPGRLARLVTPGEPDLGFVDLPGWAWPAYFAVRPVRLVLDRLSGRRGGGDLGPYLATPAAMIGPLTDAAELGSDDLLVDVGCGDGRVVIEAALRHGCRARGVERDRELAAIAQANVEAAGLADVVEIIAGDVDASSLRDATVVFAFLPPDATAEIVEVAASTLEPGGRVITHEQLDFPWPREPDRSGLVLGQGMTVARMWRFG